MQIEFIQQAIGQAAQGVLETMFFTIPEGDAPYGQEGEASAGLAMLRTSLRFSGAWSGAFSVETSLEAAREIAANFTGAMDPSEVSDEKTGEVLSELANMVCGSTLSILDHDQLFDLSSPQLLTRAETTAEAPEQHSPGQRARRALDLGNGSAIVFSLHSVAVEP